MGSDDAADPHHGVIGRERHLMECLHTRLGARVLLGPTTLLSGRFGSINAIAQIERIISLDCGSFHEPMSMEQRHAMNQTILKSFLERYGKALSAGDAKEIAKCWGIPALVLSNEGALAVSDAAEVERFFSGAVEYYRSQGLVAARPELERVDLLSERIAAVTVLWHAIDKDGAEQPGDHSYYILHLGDDGEPQIRTTATLPV